MKQKYCNLISKVLMAIFLASIFTGCGDANATVNTVPAPKVEAIPETSNNVTETVEAAAEEEEESTEVEQEQSAEIESEIPAEPVLDESKYFVDGIFYPKEYARQLGYKFYESSSVEDYFSINRDGVEYYILVTWDVCNLYFERDGKCYIVGTNEKLAPDVIPECSIATADVVEENSRDFLNAEMTIIREVASGNVNDPTLWDISGVDFGVVTYNCAATYYEDGFIKARDFSNEESHFRRNYK